MGIGDWGLGIGNKLGTIGYLKNFMSGQLQKVMNKEGNEDEDNNEDEEKKM